MFTVKNSLAEFYGEILKSGELCRRELAGAAVDNDFAPPFELPPLDHRLERFFSASAIDVHDALGYGGSTIRLLDLTANTRTRTTKTFAAHVMVARAVRHIQLTGESVLLVTPTSANKGGALRDAVLRAIECGLVHSEQLRIAIVVPRQGLPKLWSSALSSSPMLRALNPVFLAQAEDGSVVKRLTKAFVQEHSPLLLREHGLRMWHTYQLENYSMADALRAFVEARWLPPPPPGATRFHAQAVSSAFGLLGYEHGRRVLAEMLGQRDLTPSRWLLVQHLGTPDLILHHLHGSCERENLPAYETDPGTGLHVQSASPHFPARTLALNEVIDSTFYSQNPITAERVKAAMDRHGGTGIVVSLQECLDRYGLLRSMLPAGGPQLPEDPRNLREWALAMVMTGVLGAIDRGLVPQGSEVVVHVSGSYSAQDYVPLPAADTIAVAQVQHLLDAIIDGCRHSSWRPGPGSSGNHADDSFIASQRNTAQG